MYMRMFGCFVSITSVMKFDEILMKGNHMYYDSSYCALVIAMILVKYFFMYSPSLASWYKKVLCVQVVPSLECQRSVAYMWKPSAASCFCMHLSTIRSHTYGVWSASLSRDSDLTSNNELTFNTHIRRKVNRRHRSCHIDPPCVI